jgi:hypothetical protein
MPGVIERLHDEGGGRDGDIDKNVGRKRIVGHGGGVLSGGV